MNNKQLLAYAVLLGQVLAAALAVYMLIEYTLSPAGLLKRPRLHLTFQLLLGISVVLGIFRFLKIQNATDKMRKQARDQRIVRSKSLELLIFILLISTIFYSLFYTYPHGRYQPSIVENVIYFFCLGTQFLLLASLVTQQSSNKKNSQKTNFRFSAAGAILGLVVYFIYYMMMK